MRHIAALLLLTAAALSGCRSGHGKVHWVEYKYMGDLDEAYLVCDATGLKVAEVTGYHGWEVFGGNGAAYGTYQTEDQAKQHAEELVTGSDFSIRMGSKWLTCKP